MKTRLEQRANGMPVLLPRPTAVTAFWMLGVRRMALLHPPWFADDEQQLGIAYFRNQGFEVVYANQLRLRAETEKTELRSQLLRQFNLILETRDTARGLIVNMTDVLFDTAKFSLRPIAREKLAKVSGIVLGHPGLKLDVEGHTDSVGTDEYNQRLSEQRGGSVRDRDGTCDPPC